MSYNVYHNTTASEKNLIVRYKREIQCRSLCPIPVSICLLSIESGVEEEAVAIWSKRDLR